MYLRSAIFVACMMYSVSTATVDLKQTSSLGNTDSAQSNKYRRNTVNNIKPIVSAPIQKPRFPVQVISRIKRSTQDLFNVTKSNQTNVVNMCDELSTKNSMIYCQGDILKAVNIHKLYNDSKTFVDMPLKESPATVNRMFHQQFNASALDKINRDDLIAFMNKYFEEPGTELEECELQDWTENPSKLLKIRDTRLREWALELNQIWKKLCRKMKSGDPDRHSLIFVPNEFVVPGGRFREFYYWDTFWIIKGLLACEMYNTTKAMLLNFAHIVNKYGFVPNGGRVYYLRRSQPPMLASMVYQYYENTHDVDFLKYMLPVLGKEFDFWQTRRKFNVTAPSNNTNYEVFFYHTESNVPRPESYREDISVAMEVDEALRPQLYQDLASAAEAGWDFSTRWFTDHKTLSKIRTTEIAPIDLNALLCWNMQIMEYFHHKLGQHQIARKYALQRLRLREAIRNIFYNESMGAWFDYNIRLKAHNLNFYPSNAVPLYGNCYPELDLSKAQRTFDFMNSSGAFSFPGGVPTSLIQDSNQQWDFPNGWPPLQHMIIEGMRKSKNPRTQEQAIEIAQRWVNGNYKVFRKTGAMWEKYDVSGTIPQPGAGGEYAVQDGFGWTNGVILDLLTSYSSLLKIASDETTPQSSPTSITNLEPSTTSGTSSSLRSFSILFICFCFVVLKAL